MLLNPSGPTTQGFAVRWVSSSQMKPACHAGCQAKKTATTSNNPFSQPRSHKTRRRSKWLFAVSDEVITPKKLANWGPCGNYEPSECRAKNMAETATADARKSGSNNVSLVNPAATGGSCLQRANPSAIATALRMAMDLLTVS